MSLLGLIILGECVVVVSEMNLQSLFCLNV
jgi:hypothetical protein